MNEFLVDLQVTTVLHRSEIVNCTLAVVKYYFRGEEYKAFVQSENASTIPLHHAVHSTHMSYLCRREFMKVI